MRLTMGLPDDDSRDQDFREAIVFHAHDIEIRQRTLIAHVADAHDLSMVVDRLQSERLLQLCRWVNCNTTEDHP